MSSARSRISESDPLQTAVNFSPALRKSFAALAESVQSSKDFDPETLQTLRVWSAGKPENLMTFVVGVTDIADELHKHVHATGDQRAKEAWEDVTSQILEHGFTLARLRGR